MGKWLDTLREKSKKPQDIEPSKPPKSGFESFEGGPPLAFAENENRWCQDQGGGWWWKNEQEWWYLVGENLRYLGSPSDRPSQEEALDRCGPRLRDQAERDPATLERVRDYLAGGE